MLQKVLDNIQANTRAFDGLVSFTSEKPLKGRWGHTTFTKFSITNSSVAGYESIRQTHHTEGRLLKDNIVQFSANFLVRNLKIAGEINMEIENKSYSIPFLARKNGPIDIMFVRINYNETTKAVKVVEMTQKINTEFWVRSDCFTTDRKTYLGTLICQNMLEIAEQYVFNYERNVVKTFDKMLQKLIEATVF